MADTDLDRLARTIAARLATLQEQLATHRRGYLHPTEGWVSGGWPD